MTEPSLAADLPAWVLAGWGRAVRSVRPTDAGMTSLTAFVELDEGLFVAKWVPSAAAGALDTGSSLARRVLASGLLTGEPLLTGQGALSFPTPDGALALLRHVPGRPLAAAPEDQVLIGRTLAQVHAVDASVASSPFMADLLELVHDVEAWVRPAVTEVLAEQSRLPSLTWGIIHGDPCPDAFRHDPLTDRMGLIDWTSAGHGPLLYDVASVIMYLGGPAAAVPFWTAYGEHSPAPLAELTEHVDAFHRLRGAVQAAYFSMRVAVADPTGVADQQENRKGLDDARQMLQRHGVVVDRS